MKRRRYSPPSVLSYIGQVRLASPLHMEIYLPVSYMKPSWASSINSSTAYIPFGNYLSWLFKATGEPVVYLRTFNESDIATTRPWGKYKSDQTLHEAKSLLKGVISDFYKDPEDPHAKLRSFTDAESSACPECVVLKGIDIGLHLTF
jgi:hypothetical protein